MIVNADDFGLSPGVNQGIIESHRDGIVRSATVLANAPCVDDAIERAKSCPDLGLGCHLTLIGGTALAPRHLVPTLADADGRLPPRWGELLLLLRKGIPREELVCEFAAQIERISASGVRLTHVDSHKHVHVLPRVLEAAIEAASSRGIR